MPMGGQDDGDVRAGIKTEDLEVLEAVRFLGVGETEGIDYSPPAIAEVDQNCLSESGTDYGYFNLALVWRSTELTTIPVAR